MTLKRLKKVYIDEDRPVPKYIVLMTCMILMIVSVLTMAVFAFIVKNDTVATAMVSIIIGLNFFQLLYSIKYKGISNLGIVTHKEMLRSEMIINMVKASDNSRYIYRRCIDAFVKAGIDASEAYIRSSDKSNGGEAFNSISSKFSKYVPKEIIYIVDSIVYNECVSRGISELDSSDIAYASSRRAVCGTNLYAYTLLEWSRLQKSHLDNLYRKSDELCSEFDSITDEMKRDVAKLLDHTRMDRLESINKELRNILDDIKRVEKSLGIDIDRLKNVEEREGVGA